MATPRTRWEVVRNGIELRSGVPGHRGCGSGEVHINDVTWMGDLDGWQI